MSQAPPVLSIEEAAGYLRIDAKALVRMARAKKIGHLKIGRVMSFPQTVLDEYIEAHTTKAERNSHGLTDAAAAEVKSSRLGRISV